MEMVSPYRFYIFLTIGALLTAWLADYFLSSSPLFRAPLPAHSADYFSSGYSKLEMNPLGQPKNKLVADKMVHFSDDLSTEMTKPVMTLYNEDKLPPWIIHSQAGLLSGDKNDLFLQGKVNINRAKTSEQSAIIINTTDLHVKPDDSYAKTTQWAELIMSPHYTEGVGMEVYFAEKIRLKLHTKVRSRFYEK